MAKRDPATEAKEAMSRIVHDVWKADPRLGDADVASTLAERVTTVGLDGPVFQAQHFYDGLLPRGVPHDPLVEALIVVAAHAAQKKIGVRQPRVAQHVSQERVKQLTAAFEPPKAPGAAKRRRRWQQASAVPRRIAIGVVAALIAGATAASVPQSGLSPATVAFTADAMPCDKPRVSARHLFCGVTTDVVGTDEQLRARIVKSQYLARVAGYDTVVFVKDNAAYRPALWGADPPAPPPPPKVHQRRQ